MNFVCFQKRPPLSAHSTFRAFHEKRPTHLTPTGTSFCSHYSQSIGIENIKKKIPQVFYDFYEPVFFSAFSKLSCLFYRQIYHGVCSINTYEMIDNLS